MKQPQIAWTSDAIFPAKNSSLADSPQRKMDKRFAVQLRDPHDSGHSHPAVRNLLYRVERAGRCSACPVDAAVRIGFFFKRAIDAETRRDNSNSSTGA